MAQEGINNLRFVVSLNTEGGSEVVSTIENVTDATKKATAAGEENVVVNKDVADSLDKKEQVTKKAAAATENLSKKTTITRDIVNSFGKVVGTATTQIETFKDESGNTVITQTHLGTTLKASETAFGRFMLKVKEASQNMNVFRWAFVDIFFMVSTIRTLTAPFEIITKNFIEFQDRVYKVSAATGDSIESVSANIQSLAKGSVFTLNEIGDAFLEVSKAGYSSAEAFKITANAQILAIAGYSDLKTATNTLITTLAAYNLSGTQAAYVTDTIAKVSNKTKADVDSLSSALAYVAGTASQTGVPLGELLSNLGMLQQAGQVGSKSGTNLNAMLLDLLKPTDKAIKAFDRLGVNIRNMDTGAMRPASEILTEVAGKLNGVSNSGEILATIFEQRGARAASVFVDEINKSGKSLSELNKEMLATGNATAVYEQQMKSMSNLIKVNWNNLKNTFTTSAVGKVLGGIVISLIGLGNVVVHVLSGAIRTIMGLGIAAVDTISLVKQSLSVIGKSPEEFEKINEKVKAQAKEDLKGIFAPIAEEWDKAYKEVNIDEIVKSQEEAVKKATESMAKEEESVGDPVMIEDYNQALKELTATANEVEIIKVNKQFDELYGNLVRNLQLTDESKTALEKWRDTQIASIKEIQGLNEEIRNIKNENYGWNTAIDESNAKIKEENSTLDSYKKSLSEVENVISSLSNPRFTGQLEVEKLLGDLDIYEKKQELMKYGIGDAMSFLKTMTASASSGFDNMLATIDKIIDATDTAQYSYEAWQTTIKEFINQSLVEGNKLGKDVSSIIDTFATSYMGTQEASSRTSSTKNQTTAANLLQTAYDVAYGSMTNDVNYFVKSQEQVYESSAYVISQLQEQITQRTALQSSISAENDILKQYNDTLKDQQSALDANNASLAEKARRIDEIKQAEANNTYVAGNQTGITQRPTATSSATIEGRNVTIGSIVINGANMSNSQLANEIMKQLRTQ